MIHNEFIRRKDLSWKAKGILTYILTLPDDWNINLNEIMRHATEGEKAFRTGWKELTETGYVTRYPVRDEETKKISHWETVIRENVDITTSKPHTQNLHVGKVDVGNLHVGNDKLLSTNNTKYLDIPSTNNTNTANADSDLNNRFVRLWSIYPNKKGKPKALQAYKRAVKAGTTDEQIMNGIQSYKQEIQMKKIDRQFIAHGSTWFNNQRWLDEYETGQTADDFLNLDDLFGG